MFSFDDESEHVVWLEAGYLCAGCGCEYRFRFKEKLLADDPEEALGRARRSILRKGLRDIPCPECGRITAPIHRSRHPALAAAVAALAILVALIALAVWKVHTLKLFAGAVAFGAAVLFAFVNAMWLLLTRNAPSAKRRRRAHELVDRKLIRFVVPNARPPEVPIIGGPRRLLMEMSLPWLGALILGAVGLGIPSFSDAYNPDVIPGYVSPGDEVSHQFAERLITVKGNWRGQPRFNARTIPADTKPVRIVGEGRGGQWPEEFVVKREDERVAVSPEVRFRVPFQPELAGKTIDLTVRMPVEYPQSLGPAQTGSGFRYEVKLIDLESHIPLHVASTDEVNRLKALWWVAAFLAVACLTVAPLVIALRAWRARNDVHVLDLQVSNSPKSDGLPPSPTTTAPS